MLELRGLLEWPPEIRYTRMRTINTGTGALECPSMGEDVKTNFPIHRMLSVLHPGVRPRGSPEVAHTLLV